MTDHKPQELDPSRCGGEEAALVSPERERLIRATWENRRSWLGAWDVIRCPRWVVPIHRPLTLPGPDKSTDHCLDEDTLTFVYERGVRRFGEHDVGEPWERCVCEGVVLWEGPR